MKTPEEIKKGLECCYGNDERRICEECPYAVYKGGVYPVYTCSDFDAVSTDTLALIQQLERERDAAVEELKQSLSCCHYCKHDRPLCGCAKEPKLDRSCFEWHGVKEEKTNED